ncbi:MAG TPA: alanine--glyoxylate aminotransferase family protein [Candidatus Baltobacteraceae bacterium]|nr:alanine--glyoxylate aminotransferase family protein [Candidatus Baltobacteraceae bacterium]
MKKNLLFIPGPVTVPEQVLAAMSKPLVDHRGPQFAALVQRIGEGLRPVFGTRDAEILLLGSSGTGGLEAAIGSTFSPGDTVLAAPVGVFGRRLIAIAQTYGVNVEILDTDLGCALDPHALSERLRADTNRRYKGIFLTHNETSTGVQNDMAAFATALREHGGITIVDSVSGMGATEFLMDDWGYDVVVSASQKVFAAPPGVSMVAVGPRAWKAIEASKTPRFYFDLLKAREFARAGQTPWTPPVSVLFALDVALQLYHAEGAQHVWHRHAMYAQAIRSAFNALGLGVFSQPGAHSVTVVAGNVPSGVDAATLLRKLREERGVCLSGGQLELKGKIVRMGTMGDVSQTDVLGALGALEMALLEYDVPVHVGAGVQAALRVFLDLAGGSRPDAAQTPGAEPAAQTTAASR